MDNYDNWSEKLWSHFGPDVGSDDDWKELKEKVNVGEQLSGTVVCRAHFGAWVDVGLGFPALLEIIYIDDLDPIEYRQGNWMHEGMEVSGLVGAFRDENKQICLIQKGSWEEWNLKNAKI